MAKKPAQASRSPRILNRKAHHEYHILDKIEVGVVLQGCEVKSIRNGQVSLGEGYARVEPADGGLYLYNVDIAAYPQATGPQAPEPKRRRKLLAHQHQIKKLLGHTAAKGVTLVPLSMYFVHGRVKIELGLGRGKHAYDKRQTIKDRHTDRELRRAMTRKTVR